ncbi:hypothetical protein BCR33DRAFT_723905 [Rhizoclosmatium globosum]|uniref:Uncharacterized protein n=1 Tax=Rhizoclosmatium globosum TaxID=329046 RepID=A0A1Y2B9M5_9FUNG|nr:hypothetical protein BCR33DRAFT_723905 [Rhizoclosmatium globosum]|eukprot:ORY31552.1 hypothetical protein BCR33DRAFT_723905 [Rhizoclosmatium globosum]
MWTLSFFIDWEPVNTYLGTFPCTLPTYRTPWNFTSDLSTVLGSQTDWGILEVFGLPLTQGLIGGQSASPNASPSRLFEMNGPGIAYLIESVCTEPIISTAPPTKNSEVKIISSEYWGQIYNVGFQVKLPAGTHNMINFNTSDVYQKCLVSVVSGAATLTFGYTSDEWSTMTMNSIIEIVVNNKITIPLGDSIKYDFGAIHQAFGSTEVLYSNITGWIAQGIQLAMNGSDLKSYTVRQPQVSLLNWAIDANTGLYDVQSTWKGIAASIAIIGHYVLGQSDGTDSAMCAYRGSDGWGQITAPAWITTALIAILICSTVMLVVCVSSWMLIVGGGPHIDKCVEMIDNPLRTLYYMRESVGNIVTKIRGSDIGQVSLVEHLSREYIRFGEDKTTRGNEVGTLVIDEPSKVVKIARHREVA